MNGGSPNSISSIQAALAALKAGQMSLNQVIVFIYKKTLFFSLLSNVYYSIPLFDFILIEKISSV